MTHLLAGQPLYLRCIHVLAACLYKLAETLQVLALLFKRTRTVRGLEQFSDACVQAIHVEHVQLGQLADELDIAQHSLLGNEHFLLVVDVMMIVSVKTGTIQETIATDFNQQNLK